MAEQTYGPFVRAALDQVYASLGVTYEEVAADFRRQQQELQEHAARRAAALSPFWVRYVPGSTDKKLARELLRQLGRDRAFTNRQIKVAAYLAWKYRRQIDARLVPVGSVEKP